MAKNGKISRVKVRANADEEIGAPGKDSRKALVERQLMDRACELFAEKGYAGTSLTDIADALGLTRGAVYYYFKNKEALLEAIVQEMTLRPLQDITAWHTTAPDSPPERLHDFIRMRVLGVLKRPIQMRMIEATEAALPQNLLERHTAAKRSILSEYRAIVREGIRSGDFRPVDDRIAALTLIGMVNWSTYWFVEGRKENASEIAEHIADMAVHSVAIEKSRRQRFANPQAALETLQEDLEHFARLLSSHKQ